MQKSKTRGDSKITLAYLAILVAVGLGIAAYFYTGPYFGFDDGTYITYAKQILQFNFTLTQNTPYKFGYLMPTLIAASFAAFGTSPLYAVLPTIFEYVLLIILTFFVGRELFDSRVGLFASALLLTMPFVFQYSSRAIPDMLLGDIAGFALYSLALGINDAKRMHGFALLSGLVCGLAIFVKLGGIGFGIALLVAMFFLDRKAAPYFLAGFAVSIVLYGIAFYLLSFGHLSYLSAYSATQVLLTQGSLQENIKTFMDVIGGTTAIGQIYPIELTVLLAIMGTMLALIEKNKRLAYLSFVLWSLFIYLFFGTESFSQYTFITVVDRYFILFSIPLAILGSYASVALTNFLAGDSRRWVAICLLIAILAIVIVSNMPSYFAVHEYGMLIRSYR